MQESTSQNQERLYVLYFLCVAFSIVFCFVFAIKNLMQEWETRDVICTVFAYCICILLLYWYLNFHCIFIFPRIPGAGVGGKGGYGEEAPTGRAVHHLYLYL